MPFASPFASPTEEPSRGTMRKCRVMPRKCVVKVWLSKEQHGILNELARRLGTSESETLRMAMMDYAKELSLMKESIHRGKSQI